MAPANATKREGDNTWPWDDELAGMPRIGLEKGKRPPTGSLRHQHGAMCSRPQGHNLESQRGTPRNGQDSLVGSDMPYFWEATGEEDTYRIRKAVEPG